MDLKAFEAWLGGIATLSELQRRQAWQALAISEAADSDDIEPRPALKQASSRLDRAADDPRGRRRRARLARTVSRRLGNVGWTVLAVHPATIATWCVGVMRVSCPATVAKRARARSTR
jgi:hypothetical protein